MSNTVEIVVEGKNEATRVFSEVEKGAVDSARKSEQAWDKASGAIADGVKRAGEGVDTSSASLARYSDSADRGRKATEGLGRGVGESADHINRFGEASDNVDTRAMGFRDTVTGLQDTFKGLSDQSLSLGDRLFTLGAGIGDLGSAGYNLLAPAMTKVKDLFTGTGESAGRFSGSLPGVAKGIGGVAAAAAALAVGGRIANEIWGDDKVANVQNMTLALQNYAATGKNAGESARILGGNFGDLKVSMDQLDDPSWWQAIKSGVESFTGTGGLSDAVTLAKKRVGELDQSLAAMAAQSPEQARQAFQKLTQEMGLNATQTEQLRQQLPQYKNAMDQADQATRSMGDGTRQNTAALAAYLTQLQAATDPVFNLLNSLGQVTDAQNAYNEAVTQYGVNSGQARDASVQLAEAVAGAEAAALNGQLSYDQFSTALDHWVQTGAITAQQARDIRGRVDEARGAAQAYTGNYNANLFLQNHASDVLAQVKRDLASVPDNTYKHFYMQYFNQIYGSAPSNPPGYGFIGNRATGGPIGHAAEGGGRGGRTWVGEHGPELVNLPPGAFVNSAGASSRQAAGGATGAASAPVVLQIGSSGSRIDDLLVEILRKRVAALGGNVQIVLGRN